MNLSRFLSLNHAINYYRKALRSNEARLSDLFRERLRLESELARLERRKQAEEARG